MRLTVLSLLCLASAPVWAMDLTKFGGQTPSMQSTTAQKTTETKSQNSAMELSSDTQGEDSATVPLSANESLGAVNDATAAVGVTPDKSVPAVSNVMPMIPDVVPAEPAPPVVKPKYIYKGEGNVTVPTLQIKDPRIDDTYVTEMFGRNTSK